MLSSTTSSSSVSCSPDWIVYRNSRTLGARRNREADTQQQCLDACAGDSSCVSAQWFDRWTSDKCWLNDRRRPIHSSDDYTGRLKTRDWKTRDHQKCRGGKRGTRKRGTVLKGVENEGPKCRGGKRRTGKHGTIIPGWKTRPVAMESRSYKCT